MSRRPFVAGNWKMNLEAASALQLTQEVVRMTSRHRMVDVGIVPSHPFLAAAAQKLEGTRIQLGAQDLHPEDGGAYTGAVSGRQLRSCGVGFVLAGHSERRHVFGDDEAQVAAKVEAGLRVGLDVMLCIGETEAQRDAGETQAVLEQQLYSATWKLQGEDWSRLTVAYEPVWAIGTGRTASPEQAEQAHAWARKWVQNHVSETVAGALRILYGGSVKPANAAELMAREGVDGALVGGASLTADSFAAIVSAAAGERS